MEIRFSFGGRDGRKQDADKRECIESPASDRALHIPVNMLRVQGSTQ